MRPVRSVRPALGMTLLELAVVLMVLVVVAGFVPLFGGASDNAQDQAARASMRTVQEAIVGTPDSPGYLADLRALPRPSPGVEPTRQNHPQLRYLFTNPATATAARTFDPQTERGWRGPYLVSPTGRYTVDELRGFTTDYGESGDEAPCDPWAAPLVVQENIRNGVAVWQLVSAGPDKDLTTTTDNLTLDLQHDSL